MFYQGYILPLIDYGSSTWGTTSKSNLERLSKLQKRAARIILNAPYDTASSVMLNALGWPPIEKRHCYNKAVLTYKALNNLTPLYITELLIPMSQTHNAKVNFKRVFSGTQIENSNIWWLFLVYCTTIATIVESATRGYQKGIFLKLF